MKLYIFGSCSGTEPKPDRHHTALAFEINKRLYWFDAGENCSYTAHLMGLDLLCVSDIFISHPHMDHVGGLTNLLWTIRKMTIVTKELPRYNSITVHTPNLNVYNGARMILRDTEGGFDIQYPLTANKVSDGLVLKNDDIEVTAQHNLHMPENENGFQSFSYQILAEGKKIIYSGDVKAIEEIENLIQSDCDVLLMETGHHCPQEICQKIVQNKWDVKKLIFVHHGRQILYNYDELLPKCRAIFENTHFCNDKDIFEI